MGLSLHVAQYFWDQDKYGAPRNLHTFGYYRTQEDAIDSLCEEILRVYKQERELGLFLANQQTLDSNSPLQSEYSLAIENYSKENTLDNYLVILEKYFKIYTKEDLLNQHFKDPGGFIIRKVTVEGKR